jgi:hypothetical protein
MKTNNELNLCLEELTLAESQTICGGVAIPLPLAVAGSVIGIVAGLCGISYWVGYAVGSLSS